MSVSPISAGALGTLKGFLIGVIGLALVPQLGGFKIALEIAKHAGGNLADSHNKPVKSSSSPTFDFKDIDNVLNLKAIA